MDPSYLELLEVEEQSLAEGQVAQEEGPDDFPDVETVLSSCCELPPYSRPPSAIPCDDLFEVGPSRIVRHSRSDQGLTTSTSSRRIKSAECGLSPSPSYLEPFERFSKDSESIAGDRSEDGTGRKRVRKRKSEARVRAATTAPASLLRSSPVRRDTSTQSVVRLVSVTVVGESGEEPAVIRVHGCLSEIPRLVSVKGVVKDRDALVEFVPHDATPHKPKSLTAWDRESREAMSNGARIIEWLERKSQRGGWTERFWAKQLVFGEGSLQIRRNYPDPNGDGSLLSTVAGWARVSEIVTTFDKVTTLEAFRVATYSNATDGGGPSRRHLATMLHLAVQFLNFQEVLAKNQLLFLGPSFEGFRVRCRRAGMMASECIPSEVTLKCMDPSYIIHLGDPQYPWNSSVKHEKESSPGQFQKYFTSHTKDKRFLPLRLWRKIPMMTSFLSFELAILKLQGIVYQADIDNDFSKQCKKWCRYLGCEFAALSQALSDRIGVASQLGLAKHVRLRRDTEYSVDVQSADAEFPQTKPVPVAFVPTRAHPAENPYSNSDCYGHLCGITLTEGIAVSLAAQMLSSLLGGQSMMEALSVRPEFETIQSLCQDSKLKKEISAVLCVLKMAEFPEEEIPESSPIGPAAYGHRKSAARSTSGRHLIKNLRPWDIMDKHILPIGTEDLLPPKRLYAPYCGEKLLFVLQRSLRKAMQRNPADRYQTMHEFASDIMPSIKSLLKALEGPPITESGIGRHFRKMSRFFSEKVIQRRGPKKETLDTVPDPEVSK